MAADLGYTALLLALGLSVYSGITFALGGRQKSPKLINNARGGLFAASGLVSISVIILLHALLTHNFRIEYVASYTSRDMSLPYLVSALWAGNKGSLLFWAWLLSLAAVIVAGRGWSRDRPYLPYALSFIMFIQAFFLILLVSVSNPFHQLLFTPPDGMGLNPMLENPGMIIHPPALLAGYVGLTVPFALAVSALLIGRFDSEWLRSLRGWTLVSWLLLGAGNIIGAWWAYVELGWGGYWAWDPVENAGLMPWLAATALLHSLVMLKRRGIFKLWNIVLVILAFNLAIFGTFLTRSGVLSSVHTFGDVQLGPFFLTFMAITFFIPLYLLYYHRNELRHGPETESIVSREGTFLINNLLLLGSIVIIFFGTLFPAISEAVRGVKIEVGAGFFNRVNGPLFLAIILLAGICALIGWQRGSLKSLMQRTLPPLAAALILGLSLAFSGVGQAPAITAFSLSGFVLFAIIYQWLREVWARHRTREEGYAAAFWTLLRGNRPRYGGYIVHLGIIFIALGVIGSSFYSMEKEATLKSGESMTIGSYTLTYENMSYRETPSKAVVTAALSLSNSGEQLGTMRPETYFHQSYEQPVSEVAIRSTPVEDVYVILEGWDSEGNADFKVLVNPLVSWIWVGGGLLTLGGLLAFWPERRRKLPGKPAPVKTAVEDEVERLVKELRRGRKSPCSRCGSTQSEDARFCSKCGASLK